MVNEKQNYQEIAIECCILSQLLTDPKLCQYFVMLFLIASESSIILQQAICELSIWSSV